MGYNFAQTFDRTSVRPEEPLMSTATLTRPDSVRFGDPVRAVRVPAPVAPSRARLTRRGRLVLLGLSVLVLLAVISVGRTGSQAATYVENGPSLQQTTVQPGDTLWSVAQRIAPANDPREVVAQIRRINHLTSSSLQAGQQLLLPTAR
jgi:Tfp pilus assembly protein FimV